MNTAIEKAEKPGIIHRIRNRIANTISPYDARHSVNAGGYSNTVTGAGGRADKGEYGIFTPTEINNEQILETMYVESWACRKFINIPVDDMVIRWREWSSPETDISKKMSEAETSFKLLERLSTAMIQARLYGSGLLIIVSKEGKLNQPFDPTKMREGDLLHFLPVHRFDAEVKTRDINPYSPTIGQPLSYDINIPSVSKFEVHATRVIRFDGIKPLSVGGFSVYDREWGVSEVIPVITSIMQDQSVASAASHLTKEASIPIIKMQGLREALSGYSDPDVLAPDKMAQNLNMSKSLWHTMFMDSMDEFERIEVSWAGLPDVMNNFEMRLAAAANIPATRFWGQSPKGMNATGESDMRNYAMYVRSMQMRMLTTPLKIIDYVLARNAGIKADKIPTYNWVSIMDLTVQEMAEASKAKMEGVVLGVLNDVLSRDEGRDALDGDSLYGDLEPEGREADPKFLKKDMPKDTPSVQEGKKQQKSGGPSLTLNLM